MKRLEKMAREWVRAQPDNGFGAYSGDLRVQDVAFQAGFRACRDLILNNRDWDCGEYIEILRADLRRLGEDEVPDGA